MSRKNRAEILDTAKNIVCNDRCSQYGEPEYSFANIADYWQAYISHNCVSPGAEVGIGARDVANLMALFKLGRLESSDFESYDSYVDLIGYAACAADIEFPCTTTISNGQEAGQ